MFMYVSKCSLVYYMVSIPLLPARFVCFQYTVNFIQPTCSTCVMYWYLGRKLDYYTHIVQGELRS